MCILCLSSAGESKDKRANKKALVSVVVLIDTELADKTGFNTTLIKLSDLTTSINAVFERYHRQTMMWVHISPSSHH